MPAKVNARVAVSPLLRPISTYTGFGTRTVGVFSGQIKINKCWNALWFPVLVPQIVGTICEVEV